MTPEERQLLFAVQGSFKSIKDIEAEILRLQRENSDLRRENKTLKYKADHADFFKEHWDDCKLECQQLHKELAARPPIFPKPSAFRRLKYLILGR